MIQTFKAVIIPDKGNKLVGNLSKNSSKIYYTYDEAKNWAHCELNINFAAGKKCHGEIITQCAVIECGAETNAKYFLGNQYLCQNCYNKAQLETKSISSEEFWGI